MKWLKRNFVAKSISDIWHGSKDRPGIETKSNLESQQRFI